MHFLGFLFPRKCSLIGIGTVNLDCCSLWVQYLACHLIVEKQNTARPIPVIVIRCVDYLVKSGGFFNAHLPHVLASFGL
jgi:hypothetical protein